MVPFFTLFSVPLEFHTLRKPFCQHCGNTSSTPYLQSLFSCPAFFLVCLIVLDIIFYIDMFTVSFTTALTCWREFYLLLYVLGLKSVQFSSVSQSCPTLCNSMRCSNPGLPVYHQLPEFTQTHVHWVSDAIQPSYPLSSPLFLPSIFPSIRVFSDESALPIRWPNYWCFSFNIILSMNTQDWSPLGWTG